jgi:DNA polymerase III subunit delta
MTIYLFWGEDDFGLTQAVTSLKAETLNPDWASFNFDRIPPEHPEGPILALTQAMTPPFGLGQRLVWLVEPPCLQSCSDALLAELARTLPQLPESTTFLITSGTKPNGRLKITKLLQQIAQVQEFAAIPPWKTDQIEDLVRQVAKSKGVRLSREAGDYLVEAVGSNTRQLHNEMDKIKLWVGESNERVGLDWVSQIVTTSTQSSLKLASAIRQGDEASALGLIADLLSRNEAPLKIVATLVGQFRTWLWLKVMLAEGERDEKAIAAAAGVHNPKRLYFLQQEIKTLSLGQLRAVMPLLMELDLGLKQGQDDLAVLQTKAIEICRICQGGGCF